MKTCDDHDLILEQAVDKAVGETPQQDPALVAVNLRVAVGTGDGILQGKLNC